MEWKFIVLIGDGMGDYAVAELNGRTPLEAARTPHLDRLAGAGRLGLVRTIPPGMEPGSDIANMHLLGYDPRRYHTGRAPLEAASMGIHLAADDVAFRCNLVTLTTEPGGVTRMEDYSAGHITTAEAHTLVASLQQAVADSPLSLYPGVSYRHLLVWSGGQADLPTTPPHDIPGEPIAPYHEVYRREPVLLQFIDTAARILEDHPVNRGRRNAGRSPANAVWLWGQGRAPAMPTLEDLHGLRGAMISAVDLLKGLGVYAGLQPVAVPGATGYLDTNYAGKVAAALDALEQGNFVYLHVEAPDEAAHEGSLSKKVAAIEAFDAHVVGPLVAGLQRFPAVRLLAATDHLTPLARRTHVADPVPFVLLEDLHRDLAGAPRRPAVFDEPSAAAAGWAVDDGVALFRALVTTP